MHDMDDAATSGFLQKQKNITKSQISLAAADLTLRTPPPRTILTKKFLEKNKVGNTWSPLYVKFGWNGKMLLDKRTPTGESILTFNDC